MHFVKRSACNFNKPIYNIHGIQPRCECNISYILNTIHIFNHTITIYLLIIYLYIHVVFH